MRVCGNGCHEQALMKCADTASIYTAFPPEEARTIAREIDFHCNPEHGG